MDLMLSELQGQVSSLEEFLKPVLLPSDPMDDGAVKADTLNKELETKRRNDSPIVENYNRQRRQLVASLRHLESIKRRVQL